MHQETFRAVGELSKLWNKNFKKPDLSLEANFLQFTLYVRNGYAGFYSHIWNYKRAMWEGRVGGTPIASQHPF